MSYTIYENIKEDDFLEFKSRLESIEKISSAIMQAHGFCLNRRDYDELLVLDYVYEDDFFMGNIGLTYDEDKSTDDKMQFRFYVLKTYDLQAHRFYKREDLQELFSLEQVEERFISLFEKCLSIYNALQKEDLTDTINLKNSDPSGR